MTATQRQIGCYFSSSLFPMHGRQGRSGSGQPLRTTHPWKRLPSLFLLGGVAQGAQGAQQALVRVPGGLVGGLSLAGKAYKTSQVGASLVQGC